MVSAQYTFPRSFLWGSVTSAHQLEGEERNNTWWRWEEEGRAAPTGRAAEWWQGRWREDIARAAETGQNALRFSVEWSRIQPTPERWDDSALEHYRAIVREMVERGITPFLTLHHFTEPIWFAESGGWRSPEAPSLFAEFAAKTAAALKSYVPLWCTFNEPSHYIFQGYIAGVFPADGNGWEEGIQAAEGMARSHAAAYEAIHREHPEARVGVAFRQTPLSAARRPFPADAFAAKRLGRWLNGYFPTAFTKGRLLTPWFSRRAPKLANTLDWFGLSYYSPATAMFAPQAPLWGTLKPPHNPVSEHGEIAHAPEAFRAVLKQASRYGLPIFVTANGVEDGADSVRPRYLAEHIHQVWRAVNCGEGVEGYFHYSLLDGYEWDKGWERKFGLWALDRETQTRTKRPSAEVYAEICRNNMMDTETVAQYAPEALNDLLPLSPKS